MQKIFAKELERSNIHLSIRLLRILTTHDFDFGKAGLDSFTGNYLVSIVRIS